MLPRHRPLRPALLTILLAGCGAVSEWIPDHLLDGRTPRERYAARLEYAGLNGTAVARDWLLTGERALRDAPTVSPPHEEEGYLPPAEPVALAWRIHARRGQVLEFMVSLPNDTATQIFLDAWERDADSGWRHLASADSGLRTLLLEPRSDGEFLVRAQPELLRGGRFTASLRLRPVLAFPVQNRNERDVGSWFGAPRDGGARAHHGIDIFAPRGTPALAAEEGRVTRVQTTSRGGRVVWIRDRRGNHLYYAHLEAQAVEEGAWVTAGDTVGYVGNSGNARTTPPHLHFGIYRRGEGPVDPRWFVQQPRGAVARLVADTALLGVWGRTPGGSTALRPDPVRRGDEGRGLPRHSALRILAATGGWYRVRLPDGATGYVDAGAVEPADRAADRVAHSSAVLAEPTPDTTPAGVIAVLAPGDSVDVLGRFGGYVLVRTSAGAAGWVAR